LVPNKRHLQLDRVPWRWQVPVPAPPSGQPL